MDLTKPIAEIAQFYLSKGISLMPVGVDKKPLLPSWKEYQSRRPTSQEVTEWWIKYPNANIGIITGKISGITVVDFDVERDSAGAIVRQGDRSQFPMTTVVKTGNGGFHYYYRYTQQIATGVNRLPMVDIRNDGGFVVGPPSITTGSGNKQGGKYEVLSVQKYAEFPFHLFGERKKTEFLSIVSGVGDGSRNSSAASMAGKLLKHLPQQDWLIAWELLLSWNQKNVPPLTERELKTVFDSISKRESGRRGVDDVVLPEDDSEVLPLSEVAKFYEKVNTAIETGYPTIDKAMRGGFIEGDLIIISGLSGEGKTHLCQSMTYQLAQNKVPTAWFSYEVTMDEVWRRFKDMGVEDSLISYAPLKLIMSNPTWIGKKITEAKEKYNAKVIFIDHLGFLEKDASKSNDPNLASNGAYRLASLCRDFKRMALDLGIVIVLMAHVRKTQGVGQELGLNDLAYSAGIGQEADHVLMIQRDKDKGKYLDTSKLKLVKNRRTGKLVTTSLSMEKGRFIESKDEDVQAMIAAYNEF